MKSVCVFCGSRPGKRPQYLEAAAEIGREFAQRNIDVVFGGGGLGLMGAIAKAGLENGRNVLGIQPQFLEDRELSYKGLTELIIVPNMHVRKRTMYEKSDGFLIIPGGIGTLDELFEVFTWVQLGLHAKPIGIYNVEGYYDLLLAFLDHCVAEGFLTQESRNLLIVDNNLPRLLDTMAAHEAQQRTAYLTSTSQT